jgi:hypothetical protein
VISRTNISTCTSHTTINIHTPRRREKKPDLGIDPPCGTLSGVKRSVFNAYESESGGVNGESDIVN